MSIFKNRIAYGLTRVKKALVNRVNTSQPKRAAREARQSDREASWTNRGNRQELRKANRKLARQEQELAALRAMLAKEVVGGRAGDDRPGGIRAENVVWVFGSGRTGSSWLTFMMGALPDHTRWNEPRVGYLFGDLYYGVGWSRQDSKHFILADDYEGFWLDSARGLVLDGGTARFPERAGGGYLVIKEPHGSVGAPLLMKALPESRMVFLVRDPRDVMASTLDAHKKGSRPSERRRAKRPELFEKDTEADKNPDDFIKAQAITYLRDIELSKRAYDAHEGRKVLVRYEELRADTLGTMKRIYSSLEIPVGEADLVKAIERYAWENIPEEEKGPGKIRRKASPGGWREDLTPEQIAIVEEEAAPILDRFYAGDRHLAPE